MSLNSVPSRLAALATSARRPPQRAPRRAADTLFFPVAAAYAALAVPLSVHNMVVGPALLPRFAGAAGHAHELLFGFALAVVTGFLVTRATRTVVGALGLWCGARATFLLAPGSYLSAALNAAFAIGLAAIAAPQFMKAAKKWRNQPIGPILVAASGAVLACHAAKLGDQPALEHLALRAAVLLLTLLMRFMSGRTIAPAAAGHIRIQGGHLEARVQPSLEGALLVLVAAAAIAMLWPSLTPAAGFALIAAGVVALIRVARWRLWRCIGRHDLVCLGSGYAWLTLGLLLVGSALVTATPALPAAIHAIATGALGTLTITVMARTSMLRIQRDTKRLPGVPLAVTLITAAAVLRIGWPAWPMP